MNYKDSKVRCENILLIVYLSYIFWVVFVEWINLFVYLLDIKYIAGVAESISICMCVFCVAQLRKMIYTRKTRIDAESIIGTIVIIGIGVLTSVYVDNSFDTYNYHLIAQNPKFRNYFVDDYGYGNFQVWGFRLPDRLFYYFRLILGFRFGTILNSIVIAIAFVQIYNLLQRWMKDEYGKSVLNNVFCNPLIWSLVIVLQLDAIFMYGTYYVDVMALPIAIEVIRILLEEREEEQNTSTITYFALLSGVWIAFKLTNIIFVVPCVLLYVYQHIKNFKIYDWGIAIVCGAFTWSDYIIYNWVSTGNPVFPYFNTLFKSEYFPIDNFKDGRWGGQTLWEKTTWIFYAIIKPEYRQSEIYDERPVILTIGVLGTIFILIYYIIKKNKRKISYRAVIICLVAFSSAVLWGFTTGYSRYFLFGKILFGIIAFYFIIKLVSFDKLCAMVIAGICFICIIYSSLINISSMLSGRNWSWTTYNNRELFCDAINEVFKDHDITKDYDKNIDLFVLTDKASMGVAELIDENIYAINTSYLQMLNKNASNFISHKIKEANKACDIHKRDFSDVQDYVNRVNELGIYIQGIEDVEVGAGKYELVQVSNLETENKVWISNMENIEMDVSKLSGEKSIRLICGRIYDLESSKRMVANIYTYDGSDKKLQKQIKIDNMDIVSEETIVNIEDDTSKILIDVTYDDGSAIANDENNLAFILNWKIV